MLFLISVENCEVIDDRKLLELAAKAGDVGTLWWTKDGNKLFRRNGSEQKPWNPLLDDGDAFRLAVKLELPIRFPMNGTVESGNTKSGYPYWELLDNDPYAATRRAIVRAAAEIGLTME